jgi:hypothetical protein
LAGFGSTVRFEISNHKLPSLALICRGALVGRGRLELLG